MGSECVDLRDLVAGTLLVAGFTNVFTFSCSSSQCAEPIVVSSPEPFRRESIAADEERGIAVVELLVVREAYAEAEAVAFACGTSLRGVGWERISSPGAFRACGMDVGVPAFKEQDSSGRYVWSLEVAYKVVRFV